MNTTQSPLERLAALSVQRTARTDRLDEAVCLWLALLEGGAMAAHGG